MSNPETLRQQALAAAQAGDRAQAGALLEALLRDNPRDDEAWLWLASFTDSHDQALVYLSRALVINPGNDRARAGIAWLHEDRTRVEAKVQAQIQGYLHRGHRYLDSGQVDAAAWELEAAIREFPDSAELYANLAVAYYQQGRLAEAVRELETAVRLQPDYTDAYYSLGVLREVMRDQTRAMEAWQRVLQLDPDHAEARRRLVQAGWVPPEAAAKSDVFFMLCPYCHDEITEQTLTCPHCQRTLFRACPSCKALVDATQRFCPSCRQIISPVEQGSVLDHAEPGQSLLGTLRRIEAEARTTEEPKETPARRQRLRPKMLILILPTIVFWILSILAGALGLAFGLDPTRLPTGLYNLGRAIQTFAAPLPTVLLPRPLNQFAPAAMILLGLIVLSGTVVRVRWAFFANLILSAILLVFSLIDLFTGQYAAMALVRVIMTTGVIVLTLLAAGEYEEGELAHRIAASPRDADLYYNRGLLYYKRGQLDEAIAEWYQAVSVRPSDLSTRNLLGLALADRGRFKDALEQLEIARRLDPQDATTLNNILDVKTMMQQ